MWDEPVEGGETDKPRAETPIAVSCRDWGVYVRSPVDDLD